MKPFKLTVFTEPVSPIGFIPEVKSFVRPVKFFLQGKKAPKNKKYGGHYAVTRSLVEGLEKIGAAFNYNPANEKDIAENVIVLAGMERLKEAIEFKKNGRIKFLLAGPNIVDDVLADSEIVADLAIDYYVVPSEWVKDQVIRDCIKLKDRVLVWSGGIDSQYWKPTSEKDNRKEVLIYWKTEREEFCQDVVKLVKETRLEPLVIKYGDYTVSEYKEKLDRSRFAIFLSRSESQGIALAEAWSMNVPTLVFDPGEFIFYGRTLYNVSACPYLTPSVGITWKSLGELKKLIQNEKFLHTLQPREYALEKFTDEFSAKHLVKSIQSLKQINFVG